MLAFPRRTLNPRSNLSNHRNLPSMRALSQLHYKVSSNTVLYLTNTLTKFSRMDSNHFTATPSCQSWLGFCVCVWVVYGQGQPNLFRVIYIKYGQSRSQTCLSQQNSCCAAKIEHWIYVVLKTQTQIPSPIMFAI